MSLKVEKIVTKSGECFLIDAEDKKYLSQFKWFSCSNKKYAYRAKKERGKQINYLLHREVMQCTYGDGKIIDHINRNTFDCRKKNLRFVTRQINSINTSKSSLPKTSIFRGVSYHTSHKKYRAVVNGLKNGLRIHRHLGYFDDPKDAAKCWNKEMKKIWGSFCPMNRV